MEPMDMVDPMGGGIGDALAGIGGGMMGPPPPEGPRVERDPPNPEKGRADLVKHWIDTIIEARDRHWKARYKQMRDDAKFAMGLQWVSGVDQDELASESNRYKANVTLRHINQRVAALYAKNPRVRSTRKPRLYGGSGAWDGTQEQVALAMTGAMPIEQASQVLMEAQAAAADRALYTRMGKTLEIVAQYSLDETIPKFKAQAKQLVRRVLTTGIGYVKLGYQRIMEPTPDIDAKIKDATDRLLYLQQLSDDLADHEIDENSRQAAELRANIEALQKQREIVLREGVVWSFPKSWSIIIDPEVTQIRGFVGAKWIAQVYLFSPQKVQQLYGKDVGRSYTAYTSEGEKKGRGSKGSQCMVFEVYDLEGQTCFTVCEGYADYLKEPGEPDVTLEQFHPFYALTFNDVEPEGSEQGDVIPPSNVSLIRPMQREYNRAREGIRVHRIANRPAYISPSGVLGDDDKAKLGAHDDHEVIELGISKNDDVSKIIQPKPTVDIKAELYDVEGTFADLQRVAGDQEADLGGTSGSTATEASIAANSRGTSIQSNIDDLDDFLTELMRGVGQVLLLEMSPKTVREIAGYGAVWPEMSRTEVARELRLEIKAGSSGKPNRASRMAGMEKIIPFLLQVPGIKPAKLAEFLLSELDENIELDEFMDTSLPSITALNSMSKPNLAPGPGNEAQAAAGHMNAQQPGQSAGKTQGMHPAPSAEQSGQLQH